MEQEKTTRFKDEITGEWVNTLPPVIQGAPTGHEEMGFGKVIPLKSFKASVYPLYGHHKPISKIANIIDLIDLEEDEPTE